MEIAFHRACCVEHDPGQRRRAGADINEANAGLQLHRPGRIRDDWPGVRNRRRLRCNGSLYGGLSIHEPGSLCLHHPLLHPHGK